MKILKFVALIFILFLVPVRSYSSDLGSLRISLIDGDVQMRTEDTEDWVPASINMPLSGGDRIWVPEGGRTELQLKDGTYLRLGENSALEILTLDNNSYQFYLTEGRAYANFRGLKDSLLQMDTPVSSLRVYDRSRFGVDVSEDGYTDISVYRGSVYAEGEDGKTQIEAGKTLSLKEKGYAEISPSGPSDPWERWNRERDRRFADRRPPSTYLPEELSPYSNDFEQNGRWVYESEYGYVWTPTVVVSAGWAPYRVGRWVWIGGDYVWISYEPWGWVPYHYGRWAFVTSIGWCWVPPVRVAIFWGPGFVGWVQTPTYVSWVPLAPGEIYYGHGNYGPHSVNITNINITNIQVTKVVYKNVRVHNAVTIVDHDTFITGKHVDVKVKENPFLRERISIGRPDIKPQRATLMPVVKEIPQAKRPPEPIREIRVKELKERRPFARDKNASVLAPASPVKTLPVKTIERPKPVKERVGKPQTTLEGIEKSKTTMEEIEKPKATRKEIQKSKPMGGEIEKSKTTKEGLERPKSIREGTEKPKLTKEEIEKPKAGGEGIEEPKEFKPTGSGVGKTREFKPQKKGIQKSKELEPVEKRIEKRHKPLEKEAEKPGS